MTQSATHGIFRTLAIVAWSALLANCSGGSSTPVASFVTAPTAPTTAPSSAATNAPASSAGASAMFTIAIPAGTTTAASARAASLSRTPSYVSTGTTSITISVTKVNGVAPSPAISSSVAISSCPIVSGSYVCTVNLPLPPGSDTFLISAFGTGNVLISQQGVTKTVVPGPNNFTGTSITLDANPQTLTAVFTAANPGTTAGTAGVGTGATNPFVFHGSEPETVNVAFKDAAGKTITSGLPTISASTTDTAIAVTTSGSSVTIAPTGKNQAYGSPATYHAVSVTIAPANAATDGLSSATATLNAAINYQIAAIPNVNTTGSVSQVSLFVYTCVTGSTCAFTPVNQVTSGDGKGVIAETSTTPPFDAQFDDSGDLAVCTTLNGAGPVQVFTNAAITSSTIGAAAESYTSNIVGGKVCSVAPSTDMTFAITDPKSTTEIFSEYNPAASTTTSEFTYGTASESASSDVPAGVAALGSFGTAEGSTIAPVAVAIEGPSNQTCTPTGTAACGEIALLGSGGRTNLPLVFNNSGAFLLAWDGKDGRLIVACGTPDASAKYDLDAFAITVSGASVTAGAMTTIATLSGKPARVAVNPGTGSVAVAYSTGTTTNQIDTYNAANTKVGSIVGLGTNVRGLSFYDDTTLFVTSTTSTSAGSLNAYPINSATSLASVAFGTSAPTTVATSYNL